MDPLISIIVPVYRAESYLERCINSILAQTFKAWELLLIDDGSPDRSGEICDSYALKDERIRVFHKENGGVSSAREMGMNNASGVFSIHVDPDDWIDRNMLSSMYEKAISEKADMVVCDFMIEYSSHSFVDSQKPALLESKIFMRQLQSMERHGSLCNKLIRTQLYREQNLHFPAGMNCWEDLYICICLLHAGCRLAYISKAFYHYDFSSNENSMVRHTNINGLKAQMKCVELLESRLGSTNDSFNEMKGLVLVTAYRQNLLNEKHIREMYPEINTWYIQKYRHEWKKTNYFGLAALLSGHSLKTVRIMTFISRILSRLLLKLRIIKSE